VELAGDDALTRAIAPPEGIVELRLKDGREFAPYAGRRELPRTR